MKFERKYLMLLSQEICKDQRDIYCSRFRSLSVPGCTIICKKISNLTKEICEDIEGAKAGSVTVFFRLKFQKSLTYKEICKDKARAKVRVSVQVLFRLYDM